MNNFSQQKDGTKDTKGISECSEGMNLSPFGVENLEEELIQDILETLESIENIPTEDTSELAVPVLVDPHLQEANTVEIPGFATGLSNAFYLLHT